MRPLLEIAVFNPEAALIVDKAGADRIEFCSDYASGGLTPPIEEIRTVTNQVRCPVFVMIRARPGDFNYSETEVAHMKAMLLEAKSAGADGFVFGVLDAKGNINEEANRALVVLAAPLPCTFHRAFDRVQDQPAALQVLIRCGFQRVLTSGGPGSAIDNLTRIKELTNLAADRIIIMPGGGIRPSNLKQLSAELNTTEYHSAALARDTELPDENIIGELKAILS